MGEEKRGREGKGKVEEGRAEGDGNQTLSISV